jgi:hypothetical protein
MDIVKRLRHEDCCDAVYCNCDESADEIERLRELFELERKDNINLRHHFAMANEQIERLRHEMERIADVSERWPDSLVSQINEIARAAMKEGE